MHQSLENPVSDEVLPFPDAPAPDRADTAPVPAVAAVEVKKGRVLLLEDDPSFQEIIRDFLAESGYAVVAVQNGGEGVRELLSGDFRLILCDLMMPTLPGDMFYRAVERIRPELCHRIIFMSGHRGDAKMNAFIKSIGGCALQKPFPLNNLLDLFAFAEVRDTFQSVVDADPAAPVDLPASPLVHDAPAGGSLRSQAAAPALAIPAPPPAIVLRADDSPPRWRDDSRSLAFAGLAFPILLALVLGFQYSDARGDAATELAERLELSEQWRVLAPHLQEALGERPNLDRSLDLPARIAADRARPRWTPALRGIALAAGKQIELLDLQARGEAEDLGACEVRVRGLAVDGEPRLVADRFRLTIEESLRKDAPGRPVSARFEQLDDVPKVSPGQPRATFVIVAAVGPVKPPSAGGEGR